MLAALVEFGLIALGVAIVGYFIGSTIGWFPRIPFWVAGVLVAILIGWGIVDSIRKRSSKPKKR